MNKKRKWNKRACLMGAVLLLGLCGCGVETDSLEALLAESQMTAQSAASGQDGNKAQRTNKEQDGIMEQSEDQNQTLWVHICGYIKRPGIYEMPTDARLYDVLMAAGGFLDGANENALNLADYLKDGSKIYVPGLSATNTEGAAEDTENSQWESESEEEDARININTASGRLLETIPGIGPAKAQEIMTYRKENGPFETIEEIKEVAGIKDALFEKIKAFITVEE